MGLILRASCAACGYARDDLRLGGDHGQIAAHDVSHWELYRLPCCGEVESVLLHLGAPPPEVACARCGAQAALGRETRYRVATLKGEALTGHPCPRCAAATLAFERRGKFV